MWRFFVSQLNLGMNVDLTSSVYVGDEAGRMKGKSREPSWDRFMAINIGIPFKTPGFSHFFEIK